ncbi:MAG: sugar phosphate isomerase/epimerase [Pseudomonadota bacterium]
MRDVSYQLYSSRNFPPVAQTLRTLADLGYTQVEGYGGVFEDPAELSATQSALAATGLSMPSAHIGRDLLAAPERVLHIAETLGISTLICPYLEPAERPATPAGWVDLGADLASLAQPYWDQGLTVGWHNHDFELMATEGQYPLDLILAADDRLVLEMDVAWVVRAGEDPHVWMTKYADRLHALHVKDIAPSGENLDEDGWADVGHGVLDWAALLAAAEQTATKLFVMEHDNPSDDARFARRAFETVQAIYGADHG